MPRTINLLPAVRQAEIRYEILLKDLWRIIILSLFSFVLVFLVQLGVKFYLAEESNAVTAEVQQLQSQVNKEKNNVIRKQIKAINDVTADYLKLSVMSPNLSNLIRAFIALPPPEVRIASFNFEPSTKIVNINGFSPTRDGVKAMYNNILADSNEFYNVNFPLENIAEPTNINFHFTFSVKPGVLK